VQLTSITVSSILGLALLPALMLADAKENYGNNPIVYEGEVVIFRSSIYADPHLALFLDEGEYRNYGSREEVRRTSDIGGEIARCDGIESCIEVGGSYLMAPPSGETAWRRGRFDLEIVSGDPDRGNAVIVASAYGEVSYSYGFSADCGVRWVNFSVNGDEAGEIFYPVGRSLFWTEACNDGAAMMPTK
jgi:hypothetical protein